MLGPSTTAPSRTAPSTDHAVKTPPAPRPRSTAATKTARHRQIVDILRRHAGPLPGRAGRAAGRRRASPSPRRRCRATWSSWARSRCGTPTAAWSTPCPARAATARRWRASEQERARRPAGPAVRGAPGHRRGFGEPRGAAHPARCRAVPGLGDRPVGDARPCSARSPATTPCSWSPATRTAARGWPRGSSRWPPAARHRSRPTADVRTTTRGRRPRTAEAVGRPVRRPGPRAGAATAVRRPCTSTGCWRRYDLAGSRAHARVLHAAGLLTDDELAAMLAGLDALEADVARGRLHAGRRPTRTCTPRWSAG